MKTLTSKFVLSILASTLIVSGIVYASTISGISSQTISSGDTVGQGWFQAVNDKLLATQNACPASSGQDVRFVDAGGRDHHIHAQSGFPEIPHSGITIAVDTAFAVDPGDAPPSGHNSYMLYCNNGTFFAVNQAMLP